MLKLKQPQTVASEPVYSNTLRPAPNCKVRPTVLQKTSSGTQVQGFDIPFSIPSVFSINVASSALVAPLSPDPLLASEMVVSNSGPMEVVPHSQPMLHVDPPPALIVSISEPPQTT